MGISNAARPQTSQAAWTDERLEVLLAGKVQLAMAQCVLMDLNEPRAEVDPVALQNAHPECSISFDNQTSAWGATIQVSATGKRYIAGPRLAELAIKLDVEGKASG